jgi:integrase
MCGRAILVRKRKHVLPNLNGRYLRQRRSRWLVQVAVPTDLRDHFGKANIETYLRTSDRREAERRAHSAVAEILDRFERARAGQPLQIRSAAEAELRRAYDRLTADFLESHSKLPEIAKAMAEDLSDPLLAALNDNPLLGESTVEYARKMIRRAGAEPTEATVTSLSEAILRAQAAAIAMLQNGLAPPPLSNRPVQRPSKAGAGLSVADVAARYLTERQRDPRAKMTAQTEAQVRTTFRLFADHMAGASFRDVTREHAGTFLDALASLHPHYGRQSGAADLSLADLLKKYPAKDDAGLSNKTINRHQSALKTLFRWARKRGHFEGENPFDDLARARAPLSKTTWQPFTSAELTSLFAGAAFETLPAIRTLATARPWIMAVALFSGMRQGEICELDAEDIDTRNGIPYFNITAAKSEAGVRLVPIHSTLIKLGFLDYVKGAGSGPLFPGIAPAGPDKKRAHTLASRFPAFRRKQGVDRPRVAFHSFRKNFVRALEIAKVDRDRAALIVGHERGFTFRVYNPEGLDMSTLCEVVEAVNFPGFSLLASRRNSRAARKSA